MSTSKPLLSIIIPTHNRSAQLLKSLRSLRQQSWPVTQFEVVVVADSCQGDTEEVVKAFASHAPFNVQFVSHCAKSAAATRNLGASVAQGEILLFIDDDILPHADLVKAHMDARQPNAVVIGYSKPVLPENPSWWQLNARLWWEDAFRQMRQPEHRFNYRDLFSGNVSIPATLLHQVGGFNATLGGRHEDYELGVRLLKAGAKFCHVAEALGYHHDTTDFASWARRLYEEGVADVQICQHHPELRNIIFADFVDSHQVWSREKRILRKITFTFPKVRLWLAEGLLAVAILCEHVRLRGVRHHLMGALHEVYFWGGALTAIGGPQNMALWLQEAPLPPTVATNAPVVDGMDLPPMVELQAILRQATILGLRITIAGNEVMAIPPEIGVEPLAECHLRAAIRTFANTHFIPELAFHWIFTASGYE